MAVGTFSLSNRRHYTHKLYQMYRMYMGHCLYLILCIHASIYNVSFNRLFFSFFFQREGCKRKTHRNKVCFMHFFQENAKFAKSNFK